MVVSEWKYAYPVLVQIAEAGEDGVSKNDLAQRYSFIELTNAMHHYADKHYIVIIPIIDETTALVDAIYKITELGVQYIDQYRSLSETKIDNQTTDQPTDQISPKSNNDLFTKKWFIDNLEKIVIGLIIAVVGGIIVAYLSKIFFG